MAEPYLGQITIFAGSYAPVGYAFCDGKLLIISENEALYALIGATYGGDGRTTFALPDLRGRAPIGFGAGAGLSIRTLGQPMGTNPVGSETVTLASDTIPVHSHTMQATTQQANTKDPYNMVVGADAPGDKSFTDDQTKLTAFSGQAVSNAGGGAAHYNMAPFLTLNFIIATTGMFPTRS